MWIYCNLFVTRADDRSGVKLQLFQEKAYTSDHALRRTQPLYKNKERDAGDTDDTNPYWLLYDCEVDARRRLARSMTLPSFATLFVHMENRWLEMMRLAIHETGGEQKIVDGFTRFCDSFEERYTGCIKRYTDLDIHEHDYAWLCLLYINRLQPSAFLTNNLM